MYKASFDMKQTPFVRNIPVSALYEPQFMTETLSRLGHAAEHRLFCVVTGDSGTGKSTLIRKFVGSLPQRDYFPIYLSDSKLTPRWLYKGMLEPLGIDAKFYRGDAKRQLQTELEILLGVHKKKVVCILDEAHLLEKETIEEFRFLLNYKFDSESPMTLVLVGQTELRDKLKLRRYDAVRQRINVNCVLRHLDRSETEQYILSHLRYAGGREDIFTDIAMDVIHQGSLGIPREINRICENSLLYASQQGKRLIDEHTVSFVMEHEMLNA